METIISIILMIIIVISLAAPIYFLSTSPIKRKLIEVIDVVMDCSIYKVVVNVRNSGNVEITQGDIRVYIDDQEVPKSVSHEVIYPNSIGTIFVNFIPSSIEKYTYTISVQAQNRVSTTFQYTCGAGILLNPENANLTFVAYSTPHWVVFNYITGEYLFYHSNDGDLTAEEGPVAGSVPILQGISEYTIQTSWSPWENRPIDSPILIIKNPSLTTTWVFNWTDPHGSFLFRLQPVENAIDDFLIFWEDLFNPLHPPSSVDDWKDHVVRVTLLPGNKYRLAVYLAKGGYKHQFFVATTNPNPLTGTFAYEKPYGEYWSNVVGGYYEEYRVYYITITT